MCWMFIGQLSWMFSWTRKLYSGEEGSDDDYGSDMEYEDKDAFGDSIDKSVDIWVTKW